MSGEGVFVKREIHKGEIFMYYSGIHWNRNELPLYTRNLTRTEMYVFKLPILPVLFQQNYNFSEGYISYKLD